MVIEYHPRYMHYFLVASGAHNPFKVGLRPENRADLLPAEMAARQKQEQKT